MSKLPRWFVPAVLKQFGEHRRRSSGLFVAWQRTAFGAISAVRFEIAAPLARAGGLAQSLALSVADGAASIGLTVGWVGIIADEEPVLVALAPQRDLIAPRFRDALTSDATHRRPNLWLTLAPETYLASVVDPFRPFSGDHVEVLSLVRSGRARHALTSWLTTGPTGALITLALYAERFELIRLLSLARNSLGELPGWIATSHTAPANPSTIAKPRAHR